MTFAASLSGPGYLVDRLRFGASAALFAGVVSALLGVGGGIVKVPLMNLAMGVPLKVATATSNMMIGITATRPRSSTCCATRSTRTSPVPWRSACSSARRSARGSAHRIDTRLLRRLFVASCSSRPFQMASRRWGCDGAVADRRRARGDVAWRLELAISRLLVAAPTSRWA